MNSINYFVDLKKMEKERLPVYSIQLLLKNKKIEEFIESNILEALERNHNYINVNDISFYYIGLASVWEDDEGCTCSNEYLYDPYNGNVYVWNISTDYVFVCIEDNHSYPKTYHFFGNDSQTGYLEFVKVLFKSNDNLDKYKNDYVLIEKLMSDQYLTRPFRNEVATLDHNIFQRNATPPETNII